MSDEIKLPEFDRVLRIDFESFFDTSKKNKFSIKSMTTSTYVTDSRYQTIGCGIVQGEKKRWMSDHTLRAYLSTIDWSRTACMSHQAQFDGFILSHVYGVKPIFWFCTMSMANALFTNEGEGSSIAFLAEHYGLGHKGNDAKAGSWADGKRFEDFTQEEYLKYGEYCLNDCYIMGKAFEKMVPNFSDVELIAINKTIKGFTEPKVEIDRPLVEAEAKKEIERKKNLLDRLGVTRKQLGSNDVFIGLLKQVQPDLEIPMKYSKKKSNGKGQPKGGMAPAFAKKDPGMLELLEHHNEEIRWLAEARLAVKSNILENRCQRILKVCEDGRKAPIYLKYAAAHTQRWGGGDKTNFQNLPRGSKKEPSPLRMALIAPKGKMLMAIDSAQIEARGLAWLVEQNDLVEAFANKVDLYSQFASQVYGRPIDRKLELPDGIKPMEEEGNLGKTSILGLGYGMGWKKFALTLLAGPMGAPPIKFSAEDAEKMDISVARFTQENEKKLKKIVSRLSFEELAAHCAVAQRTVNLYRAKYPKVVAFWRESKEILNMMARGDTGSFGPNGEFIIEHEAILRPSGMRLHYPQLKWIKRPPTDDEDDEEFDGYKYYGGKGKGFTKIYGGLFTENICQAFCRDIIAEQMARVCCKYGYDLVTTTHDELVFLVDEAEAPQAVKNVITEMKVPPAWCAGVPLNAEGGFNTRYGLCK